MLFFAKNHFPTQNLLSDAEHITCKYQSIDNQCFGYCFGGTNRVSRDAGGTENLQKSAVFDAAKKKKCKHLQTQKKSFLCTFTFVNTQFCSFLHMSFVVRVGGSLTSFSCRLFLAVSFSFFALLPVSLTFYCLPKPFCHVLCLRFMAILQHSASKGSCTANSLCTSLRLLVSSSSMS